jgi:hypothetical protein
MSGRIVASYPSAGIPPCGGRNRIGEFVRAINPLISIPFRAKIDRFYIPNEGVRKHMGTSMDVSKTMPFCVECMRAVEDNFRATILYLQAENGLLAIKPENSN